MFVQTHSCYLIGQNYIYSCNHFKNGFMNIREYGSTLYVGMARKKNGHPCISIASGKLKSLLMYTDRLKYTYNL